MLAEEIAAQDGGDELLGSGGDEAQSAVARMQRLADTRLIQEAGVERQASLEKHASALGCGVGGGYECSSAPSQSRTRTQLIHASMSAALPSSRRGSGD